ncbi:MAG: hypothetical protein EP326_15325 [Deltaproteobacteria bacterium]|jgi:hypothetical protein|nr:MAG: hypothetical protein EP326_15325 [Deltaproteobacteria bacterium]
MKHIIVILLLFLSISCQVEEKITPLAEPITLAELQREQLMKELENQGQGPMDDSTLTSIEFGDDDVYYLKVKYNIEDIDIFQEAEMPNQFEELADSFLGLMTRIVLGVSGPQDVDLDEFVLTIPDLDIDKEIVKSVRIHRIFLQYADDVDSGSDFAADFSFINSLDIARPVNIPGIGRVDDLLFSYRKKQNRCLYKCMVFEVHEGNLLKLIEGKTELRVKPLLSVAHLPQVTDLKIKGQVELQIGLKLPL